MIPYFLILAVIGTEYLVIKYKTINKIYFAIIACIELITFTAIRGENVGADNSHYLSAYHILRNTNGVEVFTLKMPWNIDFEPGYLFFNRILAFLQLNDFMFQLIISSIIYIPIFFTIYKYSDREFISILVYFAFGLFSHSLGLQRQLIAVSIIILGLKQITKRHFVKYALHVIVASLFHISAIYMIILYFMYRLRVNKKNLIILISIELCMLMFSRNILNIIFKILPSYSHYTNTDKFTSGGSYLRLLCLTAIVVFTFLFYKKMDISEERKVSIDATALSIIVQPVAYSFGLMGRAVDYTIVFLIILVPNLVDVFEPSEKPIVSYSIIIILLFMVYLNLNGNTYVCPYYTLLN